MGISFRSSAYTLRLPARGRPTQLVHHSGARRRVLAVRLEGATAMSRDRGTSLSVYSRDRVSREYIGTGRVETTLIRPTGRRHPERWFSYCPGTRQWSAGMCPFGHATHRFSVLEHEESNDEVKFLRISVLSALLDDDIQRFYWVTR